MEKKTERREEGGGVMALVKCGVKATKGGYGWGGAEIVCVKVRREDEEGIKVMTSCMFPQESTSSRYIVGNYGCLRKKTGIYGFAFNEPKDTTG